MLITDCNKKIKIALKNIFAKTKLMANNVKGQVKRESITPYF
jgi:hypothetical protein